jgi:hypothetical protein
MATSWLIWSRTGTVLLPNQVIFLCSSNSKS